MEKIIRLTEKDLRRLVKRIVRESDSGDGKPDDFSEYEGRTDIYADSTDSEIEKKDDIDSMTQQVAEDWYRRKMYRRRLNEDDEVKKIKSCYSNSGKSFPTACEKGTHPVCQQKIQDTATSFFTNNKNAQNDPKISNFWNCINKINPTILQGMG